MTQDPQLLAQLRRGVIEHCVLALLSRGPRYGFDLVRELAAVEGLGTTEGTIYPLLSRLRKDGLLETSWQPSDQGPPRRYYELTEPGRTALAGFHRHWRSFSAAVDQVLEGEE
ncbi:MULTISPECIES: PadR family transcriptional regulator [unclassified Crossiella]|uniref:PadR family transcriptional regulator n=1 Tax=unclassified Crossiella TaxID=2620835 RepID=UPI001FFF5255|nr:MULTISPECIES: PadR family transcriptional regulator [unclassified Crossiella]MCK2243914.1 PadR family transcriptional regulator [Crossiella sp. S99.2]MCK2257228.1 PadR family transcriptional regulator [Crossiella sp. S99.1]